MNKVIKRVLSVILCALVLLSLAAPCVTAHAASSSKVPIVYIKGRSTPIYNSKEQCIYPMKRTISDVIDDNMAKIVAASLTSYTTKNWDILGNVLYDLIAPLYAEQVLDKNGEVTNGSHIRPIADPKVDKDGSYSMYQYIFDYDSRVDPLATAAELRKYVNKVLTATGAKKVQIVARCMGSDILAAYLVKYKSDPKVDTAVFYSSACNGVLINSVPFSGRIEFDADQLKKYLDKGTSNADEELEGILNSFNKVFSGVSSKLGARVANSLFEQAGDTILPRMLVATYATMPSYWAMISDEYYEDAKKYVFGSDVKKYKGLFEKADNYHYNVMMKLPSVLNTLKKNGMKINIITKYNIDFDPIYEGCNQQGDGWIEVTKSSFGGTSANKGKTLSSSYLKEMANCGLANYVSGDKVIDASTGLFPDYTFYIKNLNHTSWPTSVDTLLYDICNSSSQYKVTTNKKYTQFLTYKSNTLTPMANYKEVLNPTVKTITLSQTAFDYDGTVKKPTVTVKDTKGKALVKDTDYTVTYPSGMKAVGSYTVTVKFKGLYKDIPTKKATFTINPANVELSTKVSGTSVTLSWKKVKGDPTYRVYSYDNTTKTYTKIADTKNASYTIKGLKNGYTYRFSVRSFIKKSDKTWYSTDYTTVKVAIKPAKPVVTAVAGVHAAKLTWKKTAGTDGYQVYRANSKSGTYRKVATVTDTTYTNNKLSSGKTYYYKVRAYRIVDGKNLYGDYSAVQACKVK